MPGNGAKILSKDNRGDLLAFASTRRHPRRDQLIVLLSVKAGLWAAEIANLSQPRNFQRISVKLVQGTDILSKQRPAHDARQVRAHDQNAHDLPRSQPSEDMDAGIRVYQLRRKLLGAMRARIKVRENFCRRRCLCHMASPAATISSAHHALYLLEGCGGRDVYFPATLRLAPRSLLVS
jgi:hypothetical protein